MGAKNRRRDRLRFTSGKGKGAGAHDDIALALSLALEVLEDRRRGIRNLYVATVQVRPDVAVPEAVKALRRQKTLARHRELYGGTDP